MLSYILPKHPLLKTELRERQFNFLNAAQKFLIV